MKVLIVDDEQNARAALKGMISANFKDIEIVDDVESVPDAVKAIHKHQPDVVLLDIEMPGYLGIDLLDFFNPDDVNFKIIFITAYNNYALQAFDMAAVDYLLKPTRVDQLKRAFDRIKTDDSPHNKKYVALKENLENRELKKIVISTAEGIRICEVDEIRYFKADGSYTHVHFMDDEKIVISKSLQEYNTLEDTGLFLRINRSYIINLNAVKGILKKSGGFVVMDNGEEISASVKMRNKLIEYFKV